MELDRNALDNYITGNYGEDQFRDDRPQEDEPPTEENAYQVLQGCIFDLLRTRANCVTPMDAELIAYLDHKIGVLHQIQKDLAAYDKLRDALREILK